MRQAKDILESVAFILTDSKFTRWTLKELIVWMNLGLDDIVLHKPSASAATVEVDLVEGTLQALPDGYQSILRPVRNVRTAPNDRSPAKRITVVAEEELTGINPAWDDPYSVPYNARVKHFIFDEANPKAFYVYPGNDGSGRIELVLSAIAQRIIPAAGGDAAKIDSYTMAIPLDETYHSALIDYILYRAYSKDMQYAGSANRAVVHYQSYANSLGIKVKVAVNTSPNIKPGIPQATPGVIEGQ